MKDKIVILDDLSCAGEGTEAFVLNCDHCYDTTIYITNNPKKWKKVFANNDEIDIMTAIFSHEWLHNVILRIEDNHASRALDIAFGEGTQFKEEKHGMCRLRYVMRGARRRKLFPPRRGKHINI